MHLAVPRPRPVVVQIITVAVVAALGVAGVAAAGPGGFLADDGPEATVASTSTTTESHDCDHHDRANDHYDRANDHHDRANDHHVIEPAAIRRIAPHGGRVGRRVAGPPPLVDDPTTAFDETLCADGNHGKTVSRLARRRPSRALDHGSTVKQAAQLLVRQGRGRRDR